jgi:hypothetical protein
MLSGLWTAGQTKRQHIALAKETAQQKTFTKASRKRLVDAVQER